MPLGTIQKGTKRIQNTNETRTQIGVLAIWIRNSYRQFFYYNYYYIYIHCERGQNRAKNNVTIHFLYTLAEGIIIIIYSRNCKLYVFLIRRTSRLDIVMFVCFYTNYFLFASLAQVLSYFPQALYIIASVETIG